MLASEKIIGFVPITDAARARSFYAEKLGLKFVSEDPFAVVFESSGNMLRLTRVQEVKPQPFTILGWQVSELAALQELCLIRSFLRSLQIPRPPQPLPRTNWNHKLTLEAVRCPQ